MPLIIAVDEYLTGILRAITWSCFVKWISVSSGNNQLSPFYQFFSCMIWFSIFILMNYSQVPIYFVFHIIPPHASKMFPIMIINFDFSGFLTNDLVDLNRSLVDLINNRRTHWNIIRNEGVIIQPIENISQITLWQFSCISRMIKVFTQIFCVIWKV